MARDWSRYWRSPDRSLEAMYAHFERHVYHRHSHEAYSFGMTEEGAQSFTCRGAAHTSAAGMIMAFNPDDPHDGHATNERGFTYRMVHVGPELVAEVLGEAAGREVGLPLFTEPVIHDPELARSLRALHEALLGDATPLHRDELLDAVVLAAARRASARVPASARLPRLDGVGDTSAGSASKAGGARPGRLDGWAVEGGRVDVGAARVVREVLHYSDDRDLSAADLASAAGRSRFAVYRSFQAVYGMAPSDYQRQVRLREARRLVAEGRSLADVAAMTGFTDQSHLTRWFTRYYGVTPGAYRQAAPTP
ncbi:AraC family transcriptional regulator [Sphaerisporangium sp. TRM90804]|uniref:AraC family transcriptional regulator n=1 Tax=Sphaerisporangium sp. TRM90804 TaxID=3031113 RepID=UPI002446D0D6|nr:AraC family transcriptional regulator [Sphaerisporangium sp. TRM90804]MDH2427760.1 AraC family transcriptional regulator [Sphaerisporangium sp. TRM90804]